ncbi:hypothetical protein LEMLEM_LOCUS24292 [Lemmus lemmus]
MCSKNPPTPTPLYGKNSILRTAWLPLRIVEDN